MLEGEEAQKSPEETLRSTLVKMEVAAGKGQPQSSAFGGHDGTEGQ